MSNLFIVSIDAIALVAATAKSVLELAAPAADSFEVKEWWVDFDGVTPSNTPVKVEVSRFTAAVTTATTVTPGKFSGPSDEASQVVSKHSTSTEGAGAVSDFATIHRISPTSGYHYVAPLGNEQKIPASGFWRMRLTAAQAVNATVGVIWED